VLLHGKNASGSEVDSGQMETYPEWLKRLVPRPDVWHERVDPELAGDGTLPKANSQAKSGFFLDRLDRRDRPEAGCVGSRHSVTGHREAYCARWRRKSALRVRTSISIMTRFRLGTGLCPAPVLRSNSAHVQPVTRARSGTSGATHLCICPTSKIVKLSISDYLPQKEPIQITQFKFALG